MQVSREGQAEKLIVREFEDKAIKKQAMESLGVLW